MFTKLKERIAFKKQLKEFDTRRDVLASISKFARYSGDEKMIERLDNDWRTLNAECANVIKKRFEK